MDHVPAPTRPALSPENLLFHLLPPRGQSVVVRYGATVLILAVFIIFQFALSNTVTNRPFLLFTLPVFLSALLFNRGSGFLATALAAIAANYFFIEPKHGFLPATTNDIVGTLLFLIIGASIATLTEALRKALEDVAQGERERALLLKELNHRIRNDLQMVAALLKLSTRDGDPKQALDAAADRVHILSEVYDTLIARDDTPQLDARELMDALAGAFRARVMGMRPITITTEIEPLKIKTRCATALSLILNELVTNSLKHAFPDMRPGVIHIDLGQKEGSLQLSVADDGVGMPRDARQGFGTTLVKQLAAQHGGTVRVEADGGTTVRITMPPHCLA